MNQLANLDTGRIEPVVERLHALHPRLIDLSLDRLRRLLADLGHPEHRLPPVLHVAGTNGKGSTCAMLRAMVEGGGAEGGGAEGGGAEAAGQRVHVYTSPHLIRFNERFRVAGRIVSDTVLADAFEHVERVNDGAPITVFEVITAVAFHLFAATPADLCILEVGLGGRGDATNVIDRPEACAITSISLDHRDLLGDTLALIAAEKAGIMKPGIPVITGEQPPEALAVLEACAASVGAPLLRRFRDWTIEPHGDGLRYTDAAGSLDLPRPGLPGQHQVDNAGIAVATLRAARRPAIWQSLADARWPARLQRLHGRLASLLPPGWELWLDGAHNPGAGVALAQQLDTWAPRPTHLVIGMKQAKDVAEFLRPLLTRAASVWAVQEANQHSALPIEAVVAASGGLARPGPTVHDAITQIAAAGGPPARVLVAGSLYLAGPVLQLDGTPAEA